MTTDEAITVFLSYSPHEKEGFIARMMSELTIMGRDTYAVGRDDLIEPQRMRRINEVQHQVSAYLCALLRHDRQRYPDDVLLRILLEQPNDNVLERQLREAFARLTVQRPLSVA